MPLPVIVYPLFAVILTTFPITVAAGKNVEKIPILCGVWIYFPRMKYTVYVHTCLVMGYIFVGKHRNSNLLERKHN
jgi:hypothetical protein